MKFVFRPTQVYVIIELKLVIFIRILISLDDTFSKLYKTEMLLPVLTSVARRLGQGEMYEGIALDTDPLVMPKGASEIEVRTKQVCTKALC